MVLLTFLLKCCVMIQQEGIMQDVYTFAGTDQCHLPEYGKYSYMYEGCLKSNVDFNSQMFPGTRIA